MKFQLVILSLLITGAAGATLASGLFMPTSEEPVAKPVPPQPPPQPRLVGETTDAYFGVVKAVGADWLELEAGWEGARTFTAEGKEIVKKRDNTKVKRISVAGTTVGGNPNGIGIPRTYRITDLKVGDVVLVSTGHTLTGEEWGTEMRIKRRPGGKIPPVPGEVVPPRPAGLN